MPTDNNIERKQGSRSLLVAIGIIVLAVAAVAITGFVFMNRPDDFIEGQVEGTTVRISGKLAGRVVELYATEGDTVHAGDTLVHIHSSVVEAQLGQAEAIRAAAAAQNRKIDAGTRIQIVSAARDLLNQAEAAVTITPQPASSPWPRTAHRAKTARAPPPWRTPPAARYSRWRLFLPTPTLWLLSTAPSTRFTPRKASWCRWALLS